MAFVPISTTDGADWHGKLREAEIGSGVANVFLGDMMAGSGTGSADGRAEGILLATAGDAGAFGANGGSVNNVTFTKLVDQVAFIQKGKQRGIYIFSGVSFIISGFSHLLFPFACFA